MKNLKPILAGLMMLICFISFAQERTISGIVSESGIPIPGVNVVVKGTNRNTQTDFDGKYFIKASKGETLIFSFIGYKTKNVIIQDKDIINLELEGLENNLQEVVVVSKGYKKENRSKQKRTVSESSSVAIRGYVSAPAISVQKTSIKEKRKDSIKNLPPVNVNDEDYGMFIENQFENPKNAPLSTFSIDVDNASYTNIRRFINNGQKVPKDAVRVEEMVNFFKYDYPQPKGENPFSINTEYSDAPWNSKHKILKIGLQGKNIPSDKLPASNLVFLIDVSGSMNSENKLPLLKSSMKVLVDQLRDEDKVSIVVYAGAAGMVLPPTSGSKKKEIIDALDKLSAGGSTAGGAGIELAYKTAQENFIKNGNNRVILATDGDFNVGSSSNSDMQTLIEEKRKSGVFLTCLGFGMGNYKDSKMEILADKGNGNYAYIDNIQEANRFLGKEFKGSMFAIAKDVKIQIEFNPKHVQSYRLIGYENRKLRDEDFTNDAIDAGELGSGHTVTALYEIIPVGVKSEFSATIPDLKYTKTAVVKNDFSDELATIKFRYKKPDGDKSIEMVQIIDNKSVDAENASPDFKFSTSVAWFGLKLRDSKLISNTSSSDIKKLSRKGNSNDIDGYKAEFIRLVESVK
ncbi:von Willebrand factor type A domain-containing protein [uncultured Flavobacterium sp.]|uniref:vWA domain-containing protein n=1 Tax=uncultured Flavobacterium sp. TaxID=165435 RepID=UPI0025F0AEE7|nr:von Willebrand factor type A domain-containing protein [uncultured Flavobacterium sp.]